MAQCVLRDSRAAVFERVESSGRLQVATVAGQWSLCMAVSGDGESPQACSSATGWLKGGPPQAVRGAETTSSAREGEMRN